MKKTWKRLCTGFLALATVVTALPTTPVHAESKQYWTESKERVGIVEKVMNDGSIGSTFNEGHLTVEGEDAYCIDINTDFKNGYKTRADASTRMSADQISDVALSIEYVKQYTDSHSGISNNHAYLLRQLVVWQRLSVHLGWQCDNVRASYDEIPKATQDEVFSGAKAFVKENKGRYECGGYIYSGEGQELGQFWAKLNVGNAKLQKTSSNASITDGKRGKDGKVFIDTLILPPCLVPSYRHRPMMNSHRAFFIYRRILNEQYRNQHRHLPDCQKADRQDHLYRPCPFQRDRKRDNGGQNQAYAP